MRFPTLSAVLMWSVSVCGAEAAPKDLLGDGAKVANTAQVTTARTDAGLTVTIAPGREGYPGVTVTPASGTWDLSAFGRVEAVILNSSDKPLGLNVRVDDDGQGTPWNAENVTVKAGETKTVKVIFGHSYGFKPAHKLKSGRVARVLVFAGKTDAQRTLVIKSLVASGAAGEKPPVDPNTVRVVPKDGLLVGAGVAIDVAKQVTPVKGGTAAAEASGAIRLTFPADKGDPLAAIKPAVGRWNLNAWLEARVKVRNAGTTPLTVEARLEGNGRGDLITGPTLAPGAAGEVVVPFASASVWDGEKKGSGSHFASCHAAAILVGVAPGTGERVLVVEEVRCALPPAEAIPDWVGKRPPVEGEWVQTLKEEFDGDAINEKVWSFYGENYWDNQQTHFAKANTVIGGGVVKLILEKKRGRHNDDPKRFQSEYATGFLQTRGKFTQRYGYFEARMKLPTAPGLWPAFWMMPDRGGKGGGGTNAGGMEFDVMEHLTRYGPHRYNIAMHWDGYGKDHKSTGTDGAYVRADKDGFVTAGLLWLPGKAVYYCNGKEVARWTNDRIASVPSELMFTLPVGGWDNDAVDDAKLPGEFVIDYVRVWQRKDLK